MKVHVNSDTKEIAHCWEVLKTRHYQAMVRDWEPEKDIADRDYFKLFAILTDTRYRSFHATPENEQTIWNAVRWIIEQPFQFSNEIPKVFEINGKIIRVPKNIGLLSIGQNIQLRRVMEKSKTYDECISMAVAICLQPLYDEAKFSFDRALELNDFIGEMPVIYTRPLGFFLLSSVQKRGRKPVLNWLPILSNLTTNVILRFQHWRRSVSLHRMTISH